MSWIFESLVNIIAKWENQWENNLLNCRWHEHGCTVELCVDIAATVACVPSVTAHGQATYDSSAPAIEKTWASIT